METPTNQPEVKHRTNLSVSELHFIIRNLEARKEWMIDNPDDDSIEEGEQYYVESALGKLKNIFYILDLLEENAPNHSQQTKLQEEIEPSISTESSIGNRYPSTPLAEHEDKTADTIHKEIKEETEDVRA